MISKFHCILYLDGNDQLSCWNLHITGWSPVICVMIAFKAAVSWQLKWPWSSFPVCVFDCSDLPEKCVCMCPVSLIGTWKSLCHTVCISQKAENKQKYAENQSKMAKWCSLSVIQRLGMHRAIWFILLKSLCTLQHSTRAQKFETSGHIHNTKYLTCFTRKGQFSTAANTAVKPKHRVAADSKQQLSCPTGPNEQ